MNALAGVMGIKMLPSVIILSSLAGVTSMTVTPLVQDVKSPSYTIPGGTCMAFSVPFVGGSKKKMVVDVWDSAESLMYVAVGMARHNNKDAYGDPATLRACASRKGNNPFDDSDVSPTCWGPYYDDVDVSGYLDDDCDDQIGSAAIEMGETSTAEYKFMASDTDGCKTKDGTYYIYAFARVTTTVNFEVSKGGVGSSCKLAKASSVAGAIVGAIVSCCFLGCICAGCFYMKNRRQQDPHRYGYGFYGGAAVPPAGGYAAAGQPAGWAGQPQQPVAGVVVSQPPVTGVIVSQPPQPPITGVIISQPPPPVAGAVVVGGQQPAYAPQPVVVAATAHQPVAYATAPTAPPTFSAELPSKH